MQINTNQQFSITSGGIDLIRDELQLSDFLQDIILEDIALLTPQIKGNHRVIYHI